MKTRVKTLAVIILLLVVLVAACFAAFIIKDSGKYEYGSVDINTIAKDSDSIVIEAASFSVSAGRLWEAAQMDIWAGSDEAEAYANAEKALVEKYAMYYKAVANGITPDEETVRVELERNREISAAASNYEEFQSFLDHIGMTHDEYWDSQYENLLEYDVIARYKEQLKSEFIGSGKNEADWDAYYKQIVAVAVKQERVKAVG